MTLTASRSQTTERSCEQYLKFARRRSHMQKKNCEPCIFPRRLSRSRSGDVPVFRELAASGTSPDAPWHTSLDASQPTELAKPCPGGVGGSPLKNTRFTPHSSIRELYTWIGNNNITFEKDCNVNELINRPNRKKCNAMGLS
jgi:hypothetical protein